jgi:hypothetical protein
VSDLGNVMFTHPARILTSERLLSLEQLQALVKERAPDPAAFEEFPPIFFPAEITNNRLDAYYTRMARSSLENYAREASDGVSFQDSHNTGALGMGRTLSGLFRGAQGNGVMRVVADIYCVQNLPDTMSFIQKWRTGIARDVSIGFYGGRFICSICGNDMMDWRNCSHWPGREYDVETENDDSSKTTRKVMATADVEDAHLAEVSSVYKGATPGAVILKAQRAAEAQELPVDVARFLEQRYRHLDLHLLPTRRSFPAIPKQRRHQPCLSMTETRLRPRRPLLIRPLRLLRTRGPRDRPRLRLLPVRRLRSNSSRPS